MRHARMVLELACIGGLLIGTVIAMPFVIAYLAVVGGRSTMESARATQRRWQEWENTRNRREDEA
jgi:hypothetical protein